MSLLDLQYEWQNGYLPLKAEMLDDEPDGEGMIRYAVHADVRDSVIHINMNYYHPPLLYSVPDIEAYFERVNYPEQLPFFSDEQVFTSDEVAMMASAIGLKLLGEQSKSALKK